MLTTAPSKQPCLRILAWSMPKTSSKPMRFLKAAKPKARSFWKGFDLLKKGSFGTDWKVPLTTSVAGRIAIIRWRGLAVTRLSHDCLLRPRKQNYFEPAPFKNLFQRSETRKHHPALHQTTGKSQQLNFWICSKKPDFAVIAAYRTIFLSDFLLTLVISTQSPHIPSNTAILAGRELKGKCLWQISIRMVLHLGGLPASP